jgi:hypothetical protein
MFPTRLLPLLLLVTCTVDAQVVYRCRAVDGSSVFADRPCHTLDATPVAPPQPIGDSTLPASSAGALARALGGIPAAAIGCPGPDPATLRQRMHEALSARDINALAGLYDWTGTSHQQARGTLRELQALIDSRPGQIRLEDDFSLSLPGTGGSWLPRLQVYRDPAAAQPQASYRLVRNAGCVWLAG